MSRKIFKPPRIKPPGATGGPTGLRSGHDRRPIRGDDRIRHRVADPTPSTTMGCRNVPSSTAPNRAKAARDGPFKASVLNSTRFNPQTSKAWRGIRYFASPLIGVRCHSRPTRVSPISIRRCRRSIARNRVDPTTRPVPTSTVANGTSRPAPAASKAARTFSAIPRRNPPAPRSTDRAPGPTPRPPTPPGAANPGVRAGRIGPRASRIRSSHWLWANCLGSGAR